jgi:hypothetical protein
MQLILHVGLPKTATTTIQHVLDTAKAELCAQGVLYPGTTKTQMELVRRSQFGRLDNPTGEGSLGEAIGWLAEEIRAVRPQRVVLSCERMILVTAGAVARLQRALASGLPEVTEVRVLAYVRDPIGWATSLCQQRLKMGTTRLEEFTANPWPLGLQELLSKHVGAYGLDAVTLRYLHPDHLVNGNVVDDFMEVIGLPGFAASVPAPVLNRSLSQQGALVADVLAGLVPRGQRSGRRKRLYRRMLQAIEGPRFVLPHEVQEKIVAASRADLEHIRACWGLEIQPARTEPVDVPELDARAALAMATQIMEEVERAVADGRVRG